MSDILSVVKEATELSEKMKALKTEIDDLDSKAASLRTQWQDANNKLSVILGKDSTAQTPPVSTGDRPARSLRQAVENVLENSSQAMTARQIAEQLVAEGYPTQSSAESFPNMIAQVISSSDLIQRVSPRRARPGRFAIK